MAIRRHTASGLGASILCLTVCLVCQVAADDDPWQGQTVILKKPRVHLIRTGCLWWDDIGLPGVVERVQGDSLWLDGFWAEKNDVVLLDDAPAYFTKLINGGPETALGYLLRGMSWSAKREYDNAISDLTAAIRAEPENPIFYFARGTTFYDQKSFDAALADFNEALRLDPTFLQAMNSRACALDAKGETGKAIEQANEVLSIDPSWALAYTNRAISLLYQGEYKRALDDLNRAIRLDPRLVLAYAERGRGYMERGEYDKAIDDFNKAIELAPRNWLPYHELARVYAGAPVFAAHLRDGKQARSLAQKACELSHWDEFLPMTSLAAAYAELGDFEAAVKWQTKAMTMMTPKNRLKPLNQKRLDLYKSGQAYYEEVHAESN